MGTYPTTPRSAFLAWCQSHTALFEAKHSEIGLSSVQAAAFKAATDAAAAKQMSMDIARNTAKSATEAASDAFADLRASASEMVRSIRTFAENTLDPAVYQIANIDPPQPDTPAAPPAQPTDLLVALNPTTGALELSWKAINPAGTSGTSYIIRRRTPPSPNFEFVGVTGTKKFTDSTFSAGPDSVHYTVQGQRADSAGPVSAILTVNFGVPPGGGAMMITGTHETRLAA